MDNVTTTNKCSRDRKSIVELKDTDLVNISPNAITTRRRGTEELNVTAVVYLSTGVFKSLLVVYSHCRRSQFLPVSNFRENYPPESSRQYFSFPVCALRQSLRLYSLVFRVRSIFNLIPVDSLVCLNGNPDKRLATKPDREIAVFHQNVVRLLHGFLRSAKSYYFDIHNLK